MIRVVDEQGASVESIDVRRPVGIEITFEVRRREQPFVPGIVLTNDQGGPLFSAMDTNHEWRLAREPGRYTSTAWIPGNLLNEGTVVVSVALGTHSPGGKMVRQAAANDAVVFQVVDPGEGGTARGDYGGTWVQPVRPLLEWTVQRTTEAPA
jgi:lipopolysaccharide transport system ATP-binding protein